MAAFNPLAPFGSNASNVYLFYNVVTLTVNRIVIPHDDAAAAVPGGCCEPQPGEKAVTVPAQTYASFIDPAQVLAVVPGAKPYIPPLPFIQGTPQSAGDPSGFGAGLATTNQL